MTTPGDARRNERHPRPPLLGKARGGHIPAQTVHRALYCLLQQDKRIIYTYTTFSSPLNAFVGLRPSEELRQKTCSSPLHGSPRRYFCGCRCRSGARDRLGSPGRTPRCGKWLKREEIALLFHPVAVTCVYTVMAVAGLICPRARKETAPALVRAEHRSSRGRDVYSPTVSRFRRLNRLGLRSRS